MDVRVQQQAVCDAAIARRGVGALDLAFSRARSRLFSAAVTWAVPLVRQSPLGPRDAAFEDFARDVAAAARVAHPQALLPARVQDATDGVLAGGAADLRGAASDGCHSSGPCSIAIAGPPHTGHGRGRPAIRNRRGHRLHR